MDGMDGMNENEAVPATCSRTAGEVVQRPGHTCLTGPGIPFPPQHIDTALSSRKSSRSLPQEQAHLP